MNIRQVQPRPDAQRHLKAGDRLFHFFARSSDGETEYLVAVHLADGTIHTTCQCKAAMINFVRPPNEPCCKHAAEAVKVVKREFHS